MTVETWDEIRTSFHVAKLGTVSGAAEALGVHHATVIRHVDALEARLGTKLFQRHARGYTPTEAGLDLLQVASATDDQFTQLVGRIRGRGSEVAGEVIVTSLPVLSSRLAPMLVEFMDLHPEIRVRFLTDHRLFKLEYGEAHLAIRAGAKPDQPDNIVQAFAEEHHALYASRGYVERFGMLTDGEWDGHRFVGPDEPMTRAPFFRWMFETIPPDRIQFRTSQHRVMLDGIRAGAGIGFMPVLEARDDDSLVEMMPLREEWVSRIWLVTHVDLHRTAKVQTLVDFLKKKAGDWDVR
ncbi:LysR family transcriptional regulator [Tropicimonas sediminicola]|uniref:Transcriptional regulator, LysR family n=1 Tax=Tropicimonas sediminicola TaxID=1031541 RepID=A0A239CME1_9RHOB|nr:LysR family transcriptional regulator [Tropicimonas sediminicola]SNS20664.1 transcriptional regulator, LysR family [Tropicimonas sediminicola]